MNYEETLNYLYARLPMFQRIGKAAYKNDLNNIISLSASLNHPERKFKSVHVAGTNGKGSVSHALASVFQEHGYKTGLYTSPHLIDFRERIRINGQMIPKETVVEFTERNLELIETIQPSFFEVTVAMAYEYFAEQQVDMAIIETGLGGRLDSTNIIIPEVSVITNISFDHMDLLGDTLPKIAAEKAGIIKEGVPVVIGESQMETDQVFIDMAAGMHSAIYFADQNPNYFNTEISTDLPGDHQQKNMLTVLQTIDILKQKGYPLTPHKTGRALEQIRANTGLRGRWEIIQNKPFIVCDTGHNEAGLTVAMNELKKVPCDRLSIVFGVVNDKQTEKIWSLLPVNANWYFCRPSIPRGRDAHDLAREAGEHGINGTVCSTVPEAYQIACRSLGENGALYVGGSTFVVADLLSYLEAGKTS